MLEKYLSILELNNDATQDDIKKSYKKLAFKYHPDRNKEDDAEEKFKKISEAYQILTGKSSPHQEINRNNANFMNANDLFSQLFGKNSHMGFGQMPNYINIQQQPNIFTNVSHINIGQYQTNIINRSSSVKIVDGKKIETITEICNGQMRRKRIITKL